MKIKPLTDADFARLRARLSRLTDPDATAIARRLMRLGYAVTDELVATVASYLAGERIELDPDPTAEPTPRPKGRKTKG